MSVAKYNKHVVGIQDLTFITNSFFFFLIKQKLAGDVYHQDFFNGLKYFCYP